MRYNILSVTGDRILQVVIVGVMIATYFCYKRFNQNIQAIRNFTDHQSRFDQYSASYKKFWFQLFVSIAITSIAYFISANTVFQILLIALMIFFIIFMPTKIALNLLLKIPNDHPIMK